MTLRSKSACQASSPTLSNGAAAEVPALFSRMSTPPNCRTAAATTASQSAARETSAASGEQLAPGGLADVLRGALQHVLAARAHGDPRARASQALGGGAAHAFAATRDDRDLALESEFESVHGAEG